LVVQLKKEQNFRICTPIKSKTESDAKVVSFRPTHLKFSVVERTEQKSEKRASGDQSDD